MKIKPTFSNYIIKKIRESEGREYIIKHHYSKGCHAHPICYGLFDKSKKMKKPEHLFLEPKLIGVMAFACPCSENVREFVFGKEYKDSVIELHRLHILDETPKNTESWFISRVLKLFKKEYPKYNAVITYADSTIGHEGTIYKATNSYRIGTTKSNSTFYLDEKNRLRHPRQNGKNIKKTEAINMGWKPIKRNFKYRYLYLLAKSKKHKKKLISLCKIELN
jgi:hypothetical protein